MLACGLATLDVVQTVERLPGPDEKIVADGLLVAAGGPAANAAVAATALGAPARLLSRVGDGSIGRIVTEDLAAHGVELVDLAGPGHSPAVSTVLVTRSTGQRAVVSVNATLTRDGGPAAATAAALERALDGVRAVLVDGHHLDLAVPLAAAARGRGVPVLLDGGSWKTGLEALLEHVDVALLSADFALPARTAETSSLEDVAALGPAIVARSHGPAPIEVLADGTRWTVQAGRVEVVDTLGAGDVLHGALLAWLAAHRSSEGPTLTAPLGDGLAAAAQVASHSCAATGARGWLAGRSSLPALRRLVTG